MESLFSTALVPIVVAVVTVAGGLITWRLNERSKRVDAELARREMRYERLIGTIRGFSVSGANKEQRDRFLEELNLAWMYCSDDVIRAAYAFLDSVHVEAPEVGEAHAARQLEALGALMAAIRRDLAGRKPLRKTRLGPNDFRLLSSK